MALDLLLFIPIWTFFSNLTVIIVFLFNKKLHTVTNLCVLNLAVADFLNSITSMPMIFYLNINDGRCEFGQEFCWLLTFFSAFVTSASILTLPVISILRLMVIACPETHQKLNRNAKKSFATIFIVVWSAALSTGLSTFYKLFFADSQQILNFQFDVWPMFLASILYFWLPLIIMTASYATLLIKLNKFSRQLSDDVWDIQTFNQNDNYSLDSNTIGKLNKTKLILTVIFTMAHFFISWLPVWSLPIVFFIKDSYLSPEDMASTYLSYAFFGVFVSSGINVLIYSFLNNNLRKNFQDVFYTSWATNEFMNNWN